jgi:hypothetical protein
VYTMVLRSIFWLYQQQEVKRGEDVLEEGEEEGEKEGLD